MMDGRDCITIDTDGAHSGNPGSFAASRISRGQSMSDRIFGMFPAFSTLHRRQLPACSSKFQQNSERDAIYADDACSGNPGSARLGPAPLLPAETAGAGA
jgi:hypothetical protein